MRAWVRTVASACLALTACAGDAATTGVRVDVTETPYSWLSDYGLFEGAPRDLVPAPELWPFEPVSALWSDRALKRRQLYVPEGETIGFDDSDDWNFPVGTVAVKTFLFPRDWRKPDHELDPIETRLLVREARGFQGYVYLWNEERTDAALLLPGKRLTIEYLDEDGQPAEQKYQVPNQNQCDNCHARDDEMFLLGVHTRQLNHEIAGESPLDAFADAGLFAHALPARDELPALADPRGKAPLDERARAWLEANCAHCHRPGGGGGRSGLVLLASEDEPRAYGVCKAPVAAGTGSGGLSHDIVPGRPDESIAVFRMESDDPEVRMPELPVLTADPFGTKLVRDWIAAMTPEGCPP
jgi:uncharacterized repeat protein (TIGR03806 family)